MGFLDSLIGRTQLPKTQEDKIFAITTAAITLEAAGGLEPSHRGARAGQRGRIPPGCDRRERATGRAGPGLLVSALGPSRLARQLFDNAGSPATRSCASLSVISEDGNTTSEPDRSSPGSFCPS